MNRKNPFYFDTAGEAMRFAQKEWRDIWTLLKGKDGLFHMYPGGRVIRYPWKDPRAAK